MKAIIMPGNNVLSIRLPEAVKDQLDLLAKHTNRSKSNLAAEAISQFVDVNAWQVTGIEESLKAADRGEYVPHDAVENWIESWGSKAPLAKPKAV